MWEFTFSYAFAGFFRTGNMESGIMHCGQWVYSEHETMIRGLVPKDRLLEWSVDEGWEPLCEVCLSFHSPPTLLLNADYKQFLNHSVPSHEFPRTNNADEFKKKSEGIWKPRFVKGLRNIAVLVAVTAIGVKLTFFK